MHSPVAARRAVSPRRPPGRWVARLGVGVIAGCASGKGDDSEASWPAEVAPTWTQAAPGDIAGVGDVTGDSLGDLVVANTDAGTLSLLAGPSAGLAPTALQSVTLPAELQPTGLAFGGDLFGDGSTTLLVQGARLGDLEMYEAPTSLLAYDAGSLTPRWQVDAPEGVYELGQDLTAADIDGDGIDDVLATEWSGRWGDVVHGLAWFGALTGPDSTAGWEAPLSRAGYHTAVSISAGGDVNGDGYPDVVVAEIRVRKHCLTPRSEVNLYAGGPAGPGEIATWPDYDLAPVSVRIVPDLDGDGIDDLLGDSACTAMDDVGYATQTMVFAPGSPAGPGPATALLRHEDGQGKFGWGFGLADIDNDGRRDLVVGDSPRNPAVYLDKGEGFAHADDPLDDGYSNLPDVWLGSGGGSGPTVRILGDIDGDGTDDVGLAGEQVQVYTALTAPPPG